MLRARPRSLPLCAKRGCQAKGTESHHVTYSPQVIKPLCKQHHEEITALNGVQGRKYRTELSNKHRWFIWFQWQEGKLKPRRTWKHEQWWSSPASCPNCGSQWKRSGTSRSERERYLVCNAGHQYQFSKRKRDWEFVP